MSVFFIKYSKITNTHYEASLIQYNGEMIHIIASLIHYDEALKYYEASVIHSVEPMIHSVASLIHSVEPLIHSVEADAAILLRINELQNSQKSFFFRKICCHKIIFLNSIQETQILQR